MKTNRISLSIALLVFSFCCLYAKAEPAQSETSKQKMLIPHASWTCGMPGGIAVPEKGEEILTLKMNVRELYDLGKTQYGRRQALVIKDGTVKGPHFQGQVLPGALDFKLTVSNGVIEIEQILVLKANDGKFIYARNAGTGCTESDVRIVMDFEAPNGSDCQWLNKGNYVARRSLDTEKKILTMTVYDVSEMNVDNEDSRTVHITKPDDQPNQPWDYRKASASEKQGEQIILENVTLGASTSVGTSKRGDRNIIPITGGTLSGRITGKVLFGGADYQNFSNPPTIDARYLWQTDDGEVIIVRNTGGFGNLVPIFEANVDSNYAWLNSDKFLSSNPGMGAGGVSLTFHKSIETE